MNGGQNKDGRSRLREQRGWYFYDWANSAFSTTVATVFLGPYLLAVTKNAATGGYVHPFGIPVLAGSFFPYVLALSVVLQVFVLPVTGAIADRVRRKKRLLALFAYIGAIATMAMYLIQGSAYLFGGLLFVIANLSFGASVVVYNAFLPEIAEPDERDRASSRGWALGYLGGGLLLLANLAMFTQHESLGLSTGQAVRISLFSAGAWWALFTLIPLRTLRDRGSASSDDRGTAVVTAGFRQLFATLRASRAYPQTLIFLAAYLLYNDGIQTVITLTAIYGEEELEFGTGTIISVTLLVQFVAFVGALLLGALARLFGAKRVVLASLVLWTGAVFGAYFLKAGAIWQFYMLAAFIGIVLGGSQALSRSLFSQMIPSGQEAEYFSLYEISERGTSWLGPLLFGLTLQLTSSYRNALASLIVFFALGFILLIFVNVRRAIVEAGNHPPEKV